MYNILVLANEQQIKLLKVILLQMPLNLLKMRIRIHVNSLNTKRYRMSFLPCKALSINSYIVYAHY